MRLKPSCIHRALANACLLLPVQRLPLLYANDPWFLLPVGWKHDNGSTVIVLQSDYGSLPVDLAP